MSESATLERLDASKEAPSPQVIIERLANNQIDRKEADLSLQIYWRKAHETPNLVRLIREIFRVHSSAESGPTKPAPRPN
jgi:hypothetical protein